MNTALDTLGQPALPALIVQLLDKLGQIGRAHV